VMLAAQSRAVGDLTSFSQPATVAEPDRTVKETVCALSGMRASPWCPSQTDEWIAADRSGEGECTWHVPRAPGVIVQWPAEYIAWAGTERLLDRAIPMPSGARIVGAARRPTGAPLRDRLRIVSPPAGAVYLIDPTLRREFQTLPLRAAATDASDVEWRIDG